MPFGGRRRRLRVGPLEATWDRGGLRWISVDGTEVLRGIQLTARDADWRTLQPALTGTHIEADAESFSIAFDAHWQGEQFNADGHVVFEGDHLGRVEARLRARIAAPSVVQRLGLIVLHPATVAGRPFEAGQEIGVTIGAFPMLVTADRFATATRSMRWAPADGMQASLQFNGEPWETEDQRAWTDASFKSYSPPLSQPHPVTLPLGAIVETGVRLDVATVGAQSRRVTRRRRSVLPRVDVHDEPVTPMPSIGFSWCGRIRPGEVGRLRALGPAHLRVVVDRMQPDWRADLHDAGRDTAAVATTLQLELVGFADEGARQDLQEAVGALDVPIGGALAFGSADDDGLVTSGASAVDALRTQLGALIDGLEIGGGSRAGYAELAAAEVPFLSLDTVAFSVTPQIHATDAASIIENLATLPTLLHSGEVLGGGRPLDVLCSFRPRFDAYSNPVERRVGPGRFDDRLAASLGAAWLIGTLAGVLAAPARCVTILEASGPAGATASSELYDILDAVLSVRAGRVLRVETTGACAALVVRSEEGARVIVANLSDRSATVRLTLPGGWNARVGSTGRLELAPYGFQLIEVDPA